MIAGAVIGTLLGLALLAGVIVGVVVLIFTVKPKKKYKYTPPTRTQNGTKSSPRTTQLSTSYRLAGDGSSHNNSPSVNVVQPRKYNAGQRTPGLSTPSAPVRSGGGSHPPPPKPVSRPNPPKPLSHAPPPPTKSYPSSTSSGYRPPAAKPAPTPRYPASSPAKPPPPALAQKPQGE